MPLSPRLGLLASLTGVFACAVALAACRSPELPDLGDDGLSLGSLPDPTSTPPAWAAAAVWYQIVPERFANADPGNDPTPESMEGAWPLVSADSLQAVGWETRDWTSDWTAPADWETRLRPNDLSFTIPARRYGGDLQGVIDRLPYLDSLGVNALTLAVTDSPSAHKADARSYHHVDPHLGPDPDRDREQIALENPADPETWSTTAADSTLLELIQAVHARDMRIVLDYSFGRTSTQFWAFQDVQESGRQSDYATWYRADAQDDPASPNPSESGETGRAGESGWPAFRTVDLSGDPARGIPLDGDLAPGPKGHAFAVALRWLDPDGDGDPSDGVDGFRLEGAEQVPLGFWRDLRKLTKAVNPDAILIGAIGWQEWPETMSDSAPYLGNAFDAVMHARPFPTLRQLLDPAGAQISPFEAATDLGDLYDALPPEHLPALISMSGGHDTARLGTTLANAGATYDEDETPRTQPGYDTSRPDGAVQRAVRLYRLLQVTLPGAPHVNYGDEVGLWGADAPDNQKPMLWADLQYAPEILRLGPEVGAPGRSTRLSDAVAPDLDLLAFTRSALSLRGAYPDLFSRGTLTWEPDGDLFRFTRRAGNRTAVVVVNLSESPRATGVPVTGSTIPLVVGVRPTNDGGVYTLDGRSGAVFLSDGERQRRCPGDDRSRPSTRRADC